MIYDAVVCGAGGMGSAALAQLAKRGRRVLGVERFGRGHDRGSSAGRSRIIRMAYYEHPAYVPLLRRAYELWHELERESATHLLELCGILMVGRPDSRVIRGAIASADLYGIAIERLGRAEILRRFPTLRMHSDEDGLFEPNAGFVVPEIAIDAQLRVAERAGAELRFNIGVRGYASLADGVSLALDDGSTVVTQRLIICAGPWLAEVAHELKLALRVQRNVQIWFKPQTAAYDIDRFPAFFLDRAGLPARLYGFPDYGDGVKAALHGFGTTTSPADLERTIGAGDILAVRSALDAWMPGAAATFAQGKACIYTLTPDEHFIVDFHPNDARIVLAGGFSGHGFKFCPVVGEIVADLVIDGTTRHPVDFLRLKRLVAPAASAAHRG